MWRYNILNNCAKIINPIFPPKYDEKYEYIEKIIFEDDTMHILSGTHTIYLYSIKDLKHTKTHKYKPINDYSSPRDFIICNDYYVILEPNNILLIDKRTGTRIDSESTIYTDSIMTNICLFVIDNIIYVYGNVRYYILLVYQIKEKKLEHIGSLNLLTNKMITPKYYIDVIDSKFYVTNKKSRDHLEMYVFNKNGEQLNEVNYILLESMPIHKTKSPIQKVLIINDIICILGYNKFCIYV